MGSIPKLGIQLLRFGAMPSPSRRPRWDQASIVKILKRKRIHTRDQLAEAVGISRTTAYRQFNEDWSGEWTAPVLLQLSVGLDVHPARLILDPREHSTR
jgi:AraC-like DNA-binding protein